MFVLLVIFCSISTVRPLSYSLDATLHVGPKWGYQYQLLKLPSGRRAFVQARDVVTLSDDSSSDDSEVKSGSKKEKLATEIPLETKTGSPTSKKPKKHHKIDLHASNEDTFINSDKLKAKEHKRAEYDYESAISSDSHEDINSFLNRFTRTLTEDETPKTTKKSKKKKKHHNKHKKDDNNETFINKNNERISKTTKKIEIYKKKIKENFVTDVTYHRKNNETNKNTNVKKNSKAFNEKVIKSGLIKYIDYLMTPFTNKSVIEQWKDLILGIKQNVTEKVNEKIESVKNSSIYNIVKVKTTPGIFNAIKNKTTKKPVVKHINYDYEFYNTPPVLVLRESIIKKPVSEDEKIKVVDLQKVKDDTNINFDNLYKELHLESQKIKDNATIKSFNKHILQRTLNLFEIMESKSTEYRWKKKMKHLARAYEDKFNEFLRATKHHTIRTRLGARKVILNAIDVSNRIVNRLVSFMADDMEKKGLIYSNQTPLIFRTEINKEEDYTLGRACETFGICKSREGFNNFLVDVFIKMLNVSNEKFVVGFDGMLDSAKDTDFRLDLDLSEGLKKRIDFSKRQHVNVKRGILMILKNIIVNRNKPITLYEDSNPVDSKLHSTLAFLEIINTLDEIVPSHENNLKEWNGIKMEVYNWADVENVDVKPVMSRFMDHISKVFKSIDTNTWEIIARNAKILLS